MKSSVKPILFSRCFGVSSAILTRLGVFDPTLNIDTLLFPDPMLLEGSAHSEMRAARQTFDEYFEQIRKLLLYSKGDQTTAPWRAAKKLLSFPEIMGTCLGYGSGSISGAGAGPAMTQKLLKTGFEIVQMGIDDPDLFMAIGLFEEDFGPDLIGDMFTNVAFQNIVDFNKRIYGQIGVQTQTFSITLKNGKHYQAEFARNPTVSRDVPVILMPLDVLRDLPIALDWGGVQRVSEENREFRDSLNTSLQNLWSKKTLESKEKLKAWALSGPSAFGDLLDMLHGMDGKPYDFAGDKLGEFVWRTFGERLLAEFPFSVLKPLKMDHSSVVNVVDKIIDQFVYLVEDRDLWRELYTDTWDPRLEKSAQRLFYMCALSYCEANGLDITPEAESGRGPVDFKFSNGIDGRVLVEIKLSYNGKIPHGYEKQLDLYDKAEKALASRYIIIDVGRLGEKLKRVEAIRDARIAAGQPTPKVILVNGLRRASASKVA